MISENDIKKHIPVIIDTYSELFGEEYRQIITQRLNNLNYFIYDNITDFNEYSYTGGLESYYDFLLSCKQKELSLKFLDLIGIDISKNAGKSFADNLDEYLDNLIDTYIGGYALSLGLMGEYNNLGVLSFKPEYYNFRENRVNFLNFIKDSSTNTITVDTLEDFYQTEEYKSIKVKIDLAIEAYNQILNEYKIYKESLEPYKKYIEDEENLRKKIEDSKLEEFIKEAYSILPQKIKLQMQKCKLTMHDIFNSSTSLQEKSDIEYFSELDNLKLEYLNRNEKNTIKYFRMQYFSSFGIDIEMKSDSYENIIENPNIKKLIPSEEIVEKITKLREQKLLEAKHDFYYAKYKFESFPVFDDDIFNNIANNSICINTSINPDLNKFYSTLFFTYRNGEGGILDSILLHEFCHQIELFMSDKKLICGFDIDYEPGDEKLNPYNEQKRKYERLNENITDIFRIEALNILRNKGIYMLEKPEFSKNIQSIENHNTSKITKQLLWPFVNKYRKQVVKARILGDSDELFSQIGQENFEDLNDAINKLDYLLSFKNIISISEIDFENTDDSDLLEIDNQIKRVEQIYINMENYRTNIEKSDDSIDPDLKDLLDFIDEELEK